MKPQVSRIWLDRGFNSQVRYETGPIPAFLIGKRTDEFREPIRLLFDAGVARLPDEGSTLLVEHWQHYRASAPYRVINVLSVLAVPCLQPDAEKESITAATAVFICGSVAVEKYSLLSPRSVLRFILCVIHIQP